MMRRSVALILGSEVEISGGTQIQCQGYNTSEGYEQQCHEALWRIVADQGYDMETLKGKLRSKLYDLVAQAYWGAMEPFQCPRQLWVIPEVVEYLQNDPWGDGLDQVLCPECCERVEARRKAEWERLSRESGGAIIGIGPALCRVAQEEIRERQEQYHQAIRKHEKWREEHAEEIKAAELAEVDNQRKAAAAEVKFLKSIPVGWWAITLEHPIEGANNDYYPYFPRYHKFFPTEQEAQTWWEQVYCKRYPDEGVGPNGESRQLFAEHPEIAEQTYGPGYVERTYGPGCKIPPPIIVDKLHRVSWERVLYVVPNSTQGADYYLPDLKDDGSDFGGPCEYKEE